MTRGKKAVSPVKIIDTEKPVPVTVEQPTAHIVNKSEGKTLAPNTTEQDDINTRGQRRVNIIWEITQATIAVGVTVALIYVSVMGIDSQDLKNAFFLIIGFYFSRTNHQAIGGVGNKPTQKYEGR